MRCTSSTPAAAATSSTASITRWRTSGRRIGGSGRLMSSNAIVSFMPGVQQRAQRSGVAERVARARGGWRRRGRRGPRAARPGTARGCGRRAASRAGATRRGGTGSAAWSDRRRGRSQGEASDGVSLSFRPEVEGDLDGAAGARRRRVGDGVLVAAQGVGGADEPAEVEVADELDGRVEVGPLVGVGALGGRPRAARAGVRSTVVTPGMPTAWIVPPGAAIRRAWAIDSGDPTQSTTAATPPPSWPLSSRIDPGARSHQAVELARRDHGVGAELGRRARVASGCLAVARISAAGTDDAAARRG